jgi:hypothetical protein
MDTKAIATEILKQLGGNKFIAMTGSKNFLSGADKKGNPYLSMKLTKNLLKASHMRVTLTPLDVYTIEFLKVKKTLVEEYAKIGIKIYDEELVTLKTIDNVYCDMLQNIFTENTELYTHL